MLSKTQHRRRCMGGRMTSSRRATWRTSSRAAGSTANAVRPACFDCKLSPLQHEVVNSPAYLCAFLLMHSMHGSNEDAP